MYLSLFVSLELFLVFSSGDDSYGHFLSRCQFSSSDGRDPVYLEQFYLNKILEAQYNSTEKKLVGYTNKSKQFADYLNKEKEFLQHELWKTKICKKVSRLAYKINTVAPYVRLRSMEAEQSKHSHMLICSVYDFYPKQIKVTWLRDGKEVKYDVVSTDELPSGNWLYQLHSNLEFTPSPGENVTCMVEHASFREPRLYDWEPKPDPSMNMMAVGSAGLLLGLLFSAAGFIYSKKRSIERVVIPTNEVVYPEENL